MALAFLPLVATRVAAGKTGRRATCCRPPRAPPFLSSSVVIFS